jgi:hypothetical protein
VSDAAVPLVALGMTRYWRAEDGLRLDAGAFVRALEYAAGRTAIVVGKPDPAFYGAAVDALQVPADRVVMIGDDIHTDIEGAQRAGLAGVFVRTGQVLTVRPHRRREPRRGPRLGGRPATVVGRALGGAACQPADRRGHPGPGHHGVVVVGALEDHPLGQGGGTVRTMSREGLGSYRGC